MIQYFDTSSEIILWGVGVLALVAIFSRIGRLVGQIKANKQIATKEQELFTAQKGFKNLYDQELATVRGENEKLAEQVRIMTEKVEEYRKKAAGLGGLFNSGGKKADAMYALLLENVPVVDRYIDYKVQYFPSADYRYQFREHGSVDVGQDYTGQSYLLTFHLGELPRLREFPPAHFVDLSLGFEAHNYSPESQKKLPREQTQFIGLTLNMQGILSALLPDSRGRRIGRGIFEVYALPYTTFRLHEYTRTPN